MGIDARSAAKKRGMIESNIPCGTCHKPILILKGTGGRFALWCPGHRMLPIVPGFSSIIKNGKKLAYKDLLPKSQRA